MSKHLAEDGEKNEAVIYYHGQGWGVMTEESIVGQSARIWGRIIHFSIGHEQIIYLPACMFNTMLQK